MDIIDWNMDIYLEKFRHEFNDGKNVVSVWSAIKYCVENGVPLPDCALSYLLKTANNLLKIDTPKRESGKKIMEALGVQDIRVFTRSHKMKRKEVIYEEVYTERKKRSRGNKSIHIFNDVASKHGVSAETVKKDFEAQKAVVDENHEVMLDIIREEERGKLK